MKAKCKWVFFSEHSVVRIMKFSSCGNPIPLDFVGKSHPEILRGSPSGASKKGGVGKISSFPIFKPDYLENGSMQIRLKLQLMTIGSHILAFH